MGEPSPVLLPPMLLPPLPRLGSGGGDSLQQWEGVEPPRTREQEGELWGRDPELGASHLRVSQSLTVTWRRSHSHRPEEIPQCTVCHTVAPSHRPQSCRQSGSHIQSHSLSHREVPHRTSQTVPHRTCVPHDHSPSCKLQSHPESQGLSPTGWQSPTVTHSHVSHPGHGLLHSHSNISITVHSSRDTVSITHIHGGRLTSCLLSLACVPHEDRARASWSPLGSPASLSTGLGTEKTGSK